MAIACSGSYPLNSYSVCVWSRELVRNEIGSTSFVIVDYKGVTM